MSTLTKLRERFPVLSPPDVRADARVAIAKDVIETLEIGRMKATAGTYYELDEWIEGANESFETAALSVRKRGNTECRVCAIGAAAVCAVGLYDEAPELELNWQTSWSAHDVNSWDMRNVLARWFTRKQLDLIECAFEGDDDFTAGGSSQDARDRAIRFGERSEDDRDRLVSIMQNIVRNKGSFRP